MATFEVTKETIEVFPHPNADRLELARVGLYNIVVGKDQFASGDTVLYIPEYAVLPQSLIQALGLEGKLAGKEGNRVKPVKLRGELSQGVVAPLSLLPAGTPEQRDYAEVLGVTKWEPEIPTNMSGEVEGNYSLLSWIDVENLKKFPEMFTPGEPSVVTEKIHGTATLFTFVNPRTDSPKILVSSKGLGERKLVLKEDDLNVYWRVLHAYNLTALVAQVAAWATMAFGDGESDGQEPPREYLAKSATIRRVAFFGETFGSKIQDLHYGITGNTLGFALFDIVVEYSNSEGTFTQWLDPEDVTRFAEEVGVPQVPVLYEGPFDIEKVAELASGKEQVSGRELHIREGVVVRPLHRGLYGSGETRIGKYVSEAYLLRKGGTEYS